MSYYDYDKFVHPVPAGHVIPKGTPVRSVQYAPPVETFFTVQYDAPVHNSNVVKYYLDYDITRPELPEVINTVIYNVRVGAIVYPVAVYQGGHVWAVFSDSGKCTTLYTSEIESFDTTPPKEEAGDDNE